MRRRAERDGCLAWERVIDRGEGSGLKGAEASSLGPPEHGGHGTRTILVAALICALLALVATPAGAAPDPEPEPGSGPPRQPVVLPLRPEPVVGPVGPGGEAGERPRSQSPNDLARALTPVVAARTVALSRGEDAAMDLWDWESGVAMAGMMEAYAATGDEALADAVEQWVRARAAEGIVLRHANHATPAWAALMLHEARPSPTYLREAERAVDYLLNRAPRVHGGLAHLDDQLWDDTLIVSVPLLARYGASNDCQRCSDMAVDEVLAHARRLQDPVSGRWFHGWDASDFKLGIQPHLSAAHWARGNAWTALATTEVLRFLPESHPYHAELRLRLQRQLQGLVTRQASSGLWHTVVTRPDFYQETSGSAGIAAAILRATSRGWVDPALRPFGMAALDAVNQRVAPDGTLEGVSTGTGVAPSIENYNRVPQDRIKPYGQGLYLILAGAALGW